MKTLVAQGILKDEDIIIVNTQGLPTRNILACVHFLHRSFPDAPIVHGGDVGPTALDVMLRFDYMKSTKTKFRVPIKWGFLRPSDVYGNEDVEKALSGSMGYLTDNDKQADARVRNRECMQIVERLNELNLICDAEKKYDMNDFELGITGRLKDFVLQRLRNNSWGLSTWMGTLKDSKPTQHIRPNAISSTLSNLLAEGTYEEIRTRGNEKFAKKQFVEAVECYTHCPARR
eukprot:scaffold31942_cov155-Skeletonema_dohrnii-CCMP3373.AAC.8